MKCFKLALALLVAAICLVFIHPANAAGPGKASTFKEMGGEELDTDYFTLRVPQGWGSPV